VTDDDDGQGSVVMYSKDYRWKMPFLTFASTILTLQIMEVVHYQLKVNQKHNTGNCKLSKVKVKVHANLLAE